MSQRLDRDLMAAVQQRDSTRAAALIDQGASLDPIGTGGDTPLHRAAFSGQQDMVALLLSRGANVFAKITSSTDNGATPLHLAAMRGHTEVVRLLLSAGAHHDAKLGGGDASSTFGASPLHLAATHGHLDAVKVLVEAGAELDARDEHGSTPLHYAANSGRAGVVAALLDMGADEGLSDYYGRSAFILASKRSNREIEDMLRQASTRRYARRRKWWQFWKKP